MPLKITAPEDRRIANIHTSAFKPWLMENGDESGSSLLQLNTSKPDGVGFHVYKMDPGCQTEAHEHTADEEFLVLSGELVDNDGTVYRAGDLVWLKAGTQHTSYTQDGCVLAVYIETPEDNIADD